MRLEGRRALVTGAGQGIGRAIALRFARDGAHVVVADRNRDTAERVADEIRTNDRRSAAIEVDVRDVAACRDLVAHTVAELGGLDILVNNAGVGRAKAMLDLIEEDWDAVFAVNTKGLFFCLQSGAKSMIEQGTGGKIINLASIAGRIGRPPLTHYAASKAAVISITRSAALDLARYGITVNAMCPGIVATDLWRQLDADLTAMEGLPVGAAFQQRVASIPLGRQEEPEDVASFAAFLASSDADYVTGQAYNVCGGLVLS